jgi:3-deoxy-manno-octulosonate cytidylyltransferase (CMP-KDO synthetase)
VVKVSLLVVIPARFKSTRFPGKPLANLGGLPLVEHVWRRCCQAVDVADVVIATDDDRIASVAHGFGAVVEMTSSDCLTGTDRVAEVASRHCANWYLNVQGDEPFIDPEAIKSVIRATSEVNTEVAAINTMSVIASEAEFRSASVPKPVTDASGRLLYMSRAAIPTDKSLSFRSAFRQVGLYAFRPVALQLYQPGARKTHLEDMEDIEILRIIESGLRVQMIEVPATGLAVDTPEDLAQAENLIHLSRLGPFR